ncbi:MAG: M28 family peptidase [Gemmatimonadota bacterium]
MLPLLCIATLALNACDKLPFSGRAKTAFNADSAFAYTQAQVAFGPRVPGSAAATKAGDWIVTMMKQRADTVIEQRWKHKTAQGDSIPLRNVLARFNPKATQRVLYVTHWDSRPKADSDPVLGNRNDPVPGANDGAAGVGLFVALGDALKKVPPTVGVDLLFVDGEDYGSDWNPPYTDVLLGSQYFVNNLPSADYKPMFGVLWDMIADTDLNILQEPKSIEAAPEVVTKVWQKAEEFGYSDYFLRSAYSTPITDDHVPFIEKGFRMIDVIDLDYGPRGPMGSASPNYHHTLGDTMEHISKKSLQIVGDVALGLLIEK